MIESYRAIIRQFLDVKTDATDVSIIVNASGIATLGCEPEHSTQSNPGGNPSPATGYLSTASSEPVRLPRNAKRVGDSGIFEVRSDKVVFTPDDRRRINDTRQYPYCAVGQIIGRWPDSADGVTSYYAGTGAIINRHHVLTAAHVIYKKEKGGFLQDVTFIPGLNAAQEPFGVARGVRGIIPEKYMNADPQNSDRLSFDFALVTIDRDLGTSSGVGHFGLQSYLDPQLWNKIVNLGGYPGDIGNGDQQWMASGPLLDVYWDAFRYTIDTFGGQSGSPIWSLESNEPRICGVHSGGDQTGNYGCKLSNEKVQTLIKWISQN